MRHSDNPKISKTFDLLYKGIEITSGAQREHRVDVLEKQIKEKGIDIETVADYLNFFRYGCPPHCYANFKSIFYQRSNLLTKGC